MPEMDGAMLADEIGARLSAFDDTQLVLLSSAGMRPSASVWRHACRSRSSRARCSTACRACNTAERRAHGTGTERPWCACIGRQRCRGRVLIAEDNPVNQRVARLQVKQFGFEADVVDNGEEALSALERTEYTPGPDGLPHARHGRLCGHAGIAPPRKRCPANSGDCTDGQRLCLRPAKPAWMRGWTTTSASR